jgi:D-glycero-D-manno-heptose 1,7-bisphosphate phosphatase
MKPDSAEISSLPEDRGKNIAAFLDRDGTLCEEVGYLRSPGQIRLIPGAGEAVRRLNERGIKAVVVTNQSGVGRGFFSEERLEEIHRELARRIRDEGGVVDAMYYCPHHPTEGKGAYLLACACRKPSPGLILRAAADLNLDLKRSYCVGDRLADLECGRRVGTKGILVLTGYGREESFRAAESPLGPPSWIAPSLREAVCWIIDDLGTP